VLILVLRSNGELGFNVIIKSDNRNIID